MRRPIFKKPSRKRVLLATLLLLAGPLLILEENWRGQRAWEQCKHELEFKGEHLDLASFIPSPVPDDKNFAFTPLLEPLLDYTRDPATHKIIYREPDPPVKKIDIYVEESKTTKPKSSGWMVGHRKDLQEWQAYYRASLPNMSHPKSPAEDILAVLGRFDSLIAELRAAAAARPLSRFPLKYEEGTAMEMQHHGVLHGTGSLIALRAVAKLDLNRGDDAFADIQFGFQLVDSIQSEPMLFSGLARTGMVATLIQPVWEGIALHQWTDSQLGWMQERLGGIDLLSDYARSIRVERCMGNWIRDKIRSDPKWLAYMANPDQQEGIDPTFFYFCKYIFGGGMYQTQTFLNRFTQDDLLSIFDLKKQTTDLHQVAKMRAIIDGTEKSHSPYMFLAKITLPVYGSLPERFARSQLYVNEAITACAIERYRLAHNSLPATLDDLHMANLPHDIINGQPLHYKVNGPDNYILYSVGWNGTDEGGKLVKKDNGTPDFTQGDLVWSLKPL